MELETRKNMEGHVYIHWYIIGRENRNCDGRVCEAIKYHEQEFLRDGSNCHNFKKRNMIEMEGTLAKQKEKENASVSRDRREIQNHGWSQIEEVNFRNGTNQTKKMGIAKKES